MVFSEISQLSSGNIQTGVADAITLTDGIDQPVLPSTKRGWMQTQIPRVKRKDLLEPKMPSFIKIDSLLCVDRSDSGSLE